MGRRLAVGVRAPDAVLLDPELAPVRLSSFAGRALLVSTVPSVDTPVCDLETRRWEQEAAGLAPELTVLTVSMDLPFALGRWRDASEIRQPLASAHADLDFAVAYGVLIKEKRLLSRALFLVDPASVVRYVEYVREVDDHPDYEAALAAVRRLLNP